MKNITVFKFDLYNLFALAGVSAVVYGLWSIRGFLLMLVVALVISTFIGDFVKRCEKYKIPRVISVLVFYILMISIFFGVILFMVPVIINEIGVLAQFYPDIANFINLDFFTGQFDNISSVGDFFSKIKEAQFEKLFSSLGVFFGGLLNLIVIFIVSFYLSIQDHGLDRFLCIFTPKRNEKSVLRIWHNTQRKIGGWFRGQLIIAVILVIVTYVGLNIIGIPYALLLSLLAGLFGMVPYGIFLAVLPAIGIGIINNGWQAGLIILGFYLLVQQVLDYAVQPFIFRKMTGISSLLVILSIIIGAKLFGFIGLIIAIPVALFLLEIVSEIETCKNNSTE